MNHGYAQSGCEIPVMPEIKVRSIISGVWLSFQLQLLAHLRRCHNWGTRDVRAADCGNLGIPSDFDCEARGDCAVDPGVLSIVFVLVEVASKDLLRSLLIELAY